MAKQRFWKLSIDVVDAWGSLEALSDDDRYDEVTFYPARDALVAKLRSYEGTNRLPQEADFSYIVDLLADTEDIDDYDLVWDKLYDWADRNRVWIKTF